MDKIDRSLFNLDSLIEFRHWMHENAELSWKEFNTVSKIRQYLTETLKIGESSIKTCAKTGLIVTLKGTASPKGKLTK